MGDAATVATNAKGALAGSLAEGAKGVVCAVVRQMKLVYAGSVGALWQRFEELPVPRQRVVLLASTAATTLMLSHLMHSWYDRRVLRGGRGSPASGSGDGAKQNASNTLYESEASARQYMEFHYTPFSSTYTQKLRTLQESRDFPVRIVGKFRTHVPRTSAYLSSPNSPRRTSATAGGSPNGNGAAGANRKKRALDIGCATGASVFEMSKYFDEVVGIDYSEVFVHLANEVKVKSLKRPKEVTSEDNGGRRSSLLNIAADVPEAAAAARTNGSKEAEAYTVHYTAPVQGSNTQDRALVLSPFVFPEKCDFYCGDAMDLFATVGSGSVQDRRSSQYKDVYYWKAPVLADTAKPPQGEEGGPLGAAQLNTEADRQADTGANESEKFDAVLCSNLIDRVPDPQKLLAAFALLVKKGGILVLCDPYSWWEGATDRGKWIGGHDGVKSEEEVKRILSHRFELLSESEEPFFIRDHVRHYQLGFSHCTVWRRK